MSVLLNIDSLLLTPLFSFIDTDGFYEIEYNR